MVAITIQGEEDCQKRRRIDELLSSLMAALVPPCLDVSENLKSSFLTRFRA